MDTTVVTINQAAEQQNHTGNVNNDENQAEAKVIPDHQDRLLMDGDTADTMFP